MAMKVFTDIEVPNAEMHLFRDTAIGIYSQADTFLDIFADGAVRIGDSSAGAPTNYSQFAADGELTLHGTARVRKHITIPIEGVKQGATAPTPAIIGNYSVLQFNGSTANVDEAYTSFHVPEDWASGTDILVHVHWAPVNANAGNVKWQITYTATASNAGELISAAGTTINSIDAASTTQDELLESPDMTILAANIAAEDTLGIRIFRDPVDGQDTYGSAASLVWLEFSYIANKLGIAT